MVAMRKQNKRGALLSGAKSAAAIFLFRRLRGLRRLKINLRESA
jgi:hypothetical protein